MPNASEQTVPGDAQEPGIQGPKSTVCPAPVIAYGSDGACSKSSQRWRVIRRSLTIVLIAILIAGSIRLFRKQPVPQPMPDTGPLVSVPGPQALDTAQYYRKEIVPLLDDFDARNQAAADRAIATLHDRMQMHRAGIPVFADDISGWSTRFGVARQESSDLWDKWWHDEKNVHGVKDYVDGKFRAQIMSEDSLKLDVEVVLNQFDDDMAASRNRLYSGLSLALSKIQTPGGPSVTPNFDDFRRDVQHRADELASNAASDSIVGGLESITGGTLATNVVTEITGRIVEQILIQLGVEITAEGIEAGGATVGGATAGGGLGSLGGPAGTVIGVGTGLVVGAIVDWWLTDRFKAKVEVQCNTFIDMVEIRLRDGTDKSMGLSKAFHETVRQTSQIQRDAILKTLKEPRP